MKQFIYLDTDIVNSIIAQKDKGLVLETSSEQEATEGKEKEKSASLSLDGTAGGKLFKLVQAEASLNGSGAVSLTNHSQTVLKEIANKTLHDAAFDIAYDEIKSNYNTDPEDAGLCSYIELTESFDFVDLSYIDSFLSGSSFIDYIKKEEKAKTEAIFNAQVESELNREQQRKQSSEIKKELKKLLDEIDKKYDEMVEVMTILRQIIPYNRMLVSSYGYLIPLEDNYFRDNPKTVSFKHGGPITCFGYITNVIGKDASVSSTSISQLQGIVNSTLLEILQTSTESLYIVNPIAVYYGE